MKVLLCSVLTLLLLVMMLALALAADLPVTDLDAWQLARRGEAKVSSGALALTGPIALWPGQQFGDLDFTVRARLSEDGEAWIRFRYVDDNTHYALALRANNCDDLFLFRFSPGGNDRLLALQPLGFTPKAGKPCTLRITAEGGLIQVWLNEKAIPRISAVDSEPLGPGLIGLGGGPFKCWFDSASVSGSPDMAVDQQARLSAGALKVNFQPTTTPTVDGYLKGDGQVYTKQRGFGWMTDMEAMMRVRHVDSDPRLDTIAAVAHGTKQATFLLDCPNGDYLLTLVVGDPSYGTHQEAYIHDEVAPSFNLELPSGQHYTLKRPVTVTNGQFRLTLKSTHPDGQSGGGANWLALEPRTSVGAVWQQVSRQWDAQSKERDALAAAMQAAITEKSERRARQRAEWRPEVLPEAGPGRTVTSLGSQWLLLPESERPADQKPYEPDVSDESWHVMPVPDFIKPSYWWIYGPGQGTSDNWVEAEETRCAALTYKALSTSAAWYRQWFRAPASYAEKACVLHFEAVAAVCQVWLNGVYLGGHTGMFSPFDLDASKALRPGGLNCVTVFVSDGSYKGAEDTSDVLGVAVTVEITRDMISGLPHGMYNRNLGLWQPVELIVSDPARIAEVQLTPSLTGVTGEVRFDNARTETTTGELALRLTERASGKLLYEARQSVVLPPGNKTIIPIGASNLAPKLWSPEQPNLYDMELDLVGADDSLLDTVSLPVGFRTFEVRGNRLYLNGQPYWLRGANHCPSGLRPNDSQLAHTFLKLMHEGNTMITRTHGSSFTRTWLDAADEEGVGVSLEGIWPWTMIDATPVPSPDLVEAWKDDWLGYIRANRNHPSILMWTLNNESYWYRDPDPARRAQKWDIASAMMQAMRQLDPSRPIVPDSGYVRDPKVYTNEIAPNGWDDGDIDDIHIYYGWYSVSAFDLWGGKLETRFTGERPAISQEFSQGYPNNDTGHPTRKYITDHYVPQAWCGDWAYEDRDVSLFLDRHAFLSKELAELGRRERNKLCGLLHFANNNWFLNCFEADRIAPYAAYDAMQTALQPLLVSVELGSRHFFAGDMLQARLCVVHDDTSLGTLTGAQVVCTVLSAEGKKLAKTTVPIGETPYYSNTWVDLALKLPDKLPHPREAVTLKLELRLSGKTFSTNQYDLVLATRRWAEAPKAKGVRLIRGAEAIAAASPEELAGFLESGGKALVLNGGTAVQELLPELVESYKTRQVEIVNMDVLEHPVFEELGPLDLAWCQQPEGVVPHVAEGCYVMHPKAQARILAYSVAPHGYLTKPQDLMNHYGVTCFEAQVGAGTLLVAEISEEALAHDPIAARWYANMLNYLASR